MQGKNRERMSGPTSERRLGTIPRRRGISFIDITRVCFLLDEPCPEQVADFPFESAPQVVQPIDGSGQLHEARPEVAIPLARPQVVLDLPELFVDGLQFLGQLVETGGSRQ